MTIDDFDTSGLALFYGINSGSNEDRLKALTLGGAVISKAGTMTGGVTKDDTNCAGAGRFSDQ